MARGRGAIPPYGKNFRRERIAYDPYRKFGTTMYVLKADSAWRIKSDPTSKKWYVLHYDVHHGKVQPTLTAAMNLLLDGIDYGYYAISQSS